jgi:hypothetical protein
MAPAAAQFKSRNENSYHTNLGVNMHLLKLRIGFSPFRRGLAAVALAGCVVVFASVGVGAAGPLQGSTPGDATYKASHDTDPHIALSSAAQAQLLQKQQAARTHSSMNTCCNLIANSISVTQQGQTTGYYCGPAAMAEAVTYKGVSLSQGSAANLLKTTSGSGTAWSGVNANVPTTTGYPMPDVANYEVGQQYYLPVAVPYTPTSTDISNYEWSVKYDIDSSWPVIGDAWEVAGYAHLWGHPANQTIFHWFTIYGYNASGGGTSYADSATTVWSAVNAYNYGFDSPTLVGIIGGRGYVW